MHATTHVETPARSDLIYSLLRFSDALRTDNGNLPNTTYIWDTYRTNVSNIACRLSPSDVCVKYTYKYNHAGEFCWAETENANNRTRGPNGVN